MLVVNVFMAFALFLVCYNRIDDLDLSKILDETKSIEAVYSNSMDDRSDFVILNF